MRAAALQKAVRAEQTLAFTHYYAADSAHLSVSRLWPAFMLNCVSAITLHPPPAVNSVEVRRTKYKYCPNPQSTATPLVSGAIFILLG